MVSRRGRSVVRERECESRTGARTRGGGICVHGGCGSESRESDEDEGGNVQRALAGTVLT